MNDETMSPLGAAIRELVSGICHYRSVLKVKETPYASRRITITIEPHMADYRLLCGKNGRQIKALQAIAASASSHADKEYTVSLNESFIGRVDEKQPLKSRDSFDLEAFKRLLVSFTSICFAKPPGLTFRNGGATLKVYVDAARPEDVSTISALDSICYPYGYRHGKIIEIRLGK